MACIHFLRGNCQNGTNCRFSHNVNATRPPCKYFLLETCRKGSACMFSHEIQDPREIRSQVASNPSHLLDAVAPSLESLGFKGGVISWYLKEFPSNNTLLLKDACFAFTQSLITLGHTPRFVSDFSTQVGGAEHPREIGSISILYANPSRLHTNEQVRQLLFEIQNFVWMFPSTESEEDDGSQESLVFATLLSLAQLARTKHGFSMSFGVSFHSDQFSRWNVLRNAIRLGWKLSSWEAFEVSDFPNFKPRGGDSGNEMIVPESCRLYRFIYDAPGRIELDLN